MLQLREQKTDLLTARGRASGGSGGKIDGFITQESRLSFSQQAGFANDEPNHEIMVPLNVTAHLARSPMIIDTP